MKKFPIRGTPARWLLALTLIICSGNVFGQKHEFVIFPSIEGVRNFSVADDSVDRDDGIAQLDGVYSYSNNRFRFFAEYLLSNKEQEMERLQVGLGLGKESIAWLGRFHTTTNYWNTVFHHGQYLQTSISRPAIEQFEDFGGVLPSHVTGFMLESGWSARTNSHIDFAFSSGLGTKLTEEGLETFDVLDPDDWDNDYGLSNGLKLAYQPDQLSENQVGFQLGYSDIFVDESLQDPVTRLHEFDQAMAALYVDWRFSALHIISRVTWVDNKIEAAVNSEESFTAGYLHGEYAFSDSWTVFARIEGSKDIEESLYMSFFPEFPTSKILGGVRFDFLTRHALTFEAASIETQLDDYSQVRVQWSLFVP
jgi:hypothetical protein